jgi:DNA polymerase I
MTTMNSTETRTSNKTLVLVDGNSLAFRSFFALITSGLRRSDGTPTWAVYGFFNSLFDIMERQTPDCLAVAFDLKGPTIRHEEYAEYKANRLAMPDDLSAQWPLIKEGVKVLGIPIWELSGYEADDVIGTIAKSAAPKQLKVTILTGDQDAFQLLDDNIQVLMPSKEGLKTYGRQEVFNKLGVWPEQVIDYKGLCGDTSDNIPGVRGIGPKTAVQLLTQYSTVEGIYENLDKITSKSVLSKLTEGKDNAFMSKSLATICLDAPVEFDFEHCHLKLPDVPEVANFFRSTVEANAILRRLPKILRLFNDGNEIEADSTLFEPIGKPQRARMSFKKTEGADEAASSSPAASGTALSGVALQQKLALSFPTATSTKVAELDSSTIQTDEQFSELLATLAKQQVLAAEVLIDSPSSCEGCIVGIAFAWNDACRFTTAERAKFSTAGEPTKTAYLPLGLQATAQLDRDQVLSRLKPILEDQKIGKVSYNSKLELNAFALVGIDYGPLIFDAMLASYVINPDENHKMREQARRVLGYNMENAADILGTGKKQLNWDMVPVHTAAHYACDAARVSLELAAFYTQNLDDDQQDLLWNMDLPLSAVLSKIETNGIRLDVPFFQSYAAELQTELARLEKEIFEMAGHSFNINSPLQLQKVLFDELKLSTKAKTKSGYSTDASVLEALKDDHAIVGHILEYRHVNKLYSTYVEALPRQISPRDGRLHGEFNQTSTATGRLSSTNPNLQNIPIRTEIGNRIRKGFIPAEGNVLLSADYSQIELRLLAHMSGDEKLIDAFQKDQDIHSRTAMDVFELTEEQVTADHRRIGKTLNFALIYQQGAFATGQSLGISTREAKEFTDKYFATFPKVRSFMVQIIDEARQNNYVQTLWGRRRYFYNLNDRNDMVRKADERAAFNAPLQGSAADLIKLAMIRLQKELTERNLGAKLVLQVHDELVLDVPKAEVELVKQLVMEAMAQEQPLKVPLKIDIGVGPNWMEAK